MLSSGTLDLELGCVAAAVDGLERHRDADFTLAAYFRLAACEFDLRQRECVRSHAVCQGEHDGHFAFVIEGIKQGVVLIIRSQLAGDNRAASRATDAGGLAHNRQIFNAVFQRQLDGADAGHGTAAHRD